MKIWNFIFTFILQTLLMKQFFTAGLIYSLFLVGCDQSTDRSFSDRIVSSKTASHQLVKGTRVYMVAPPGFVQSEEFAGFKKGDASINIMDMDGIDFETSAGTISKRKVETNGKKLLEEGDLTVNGANARYVRVNADGENHVIAFAFGDSSYSVFLNCVYKANDDATKKAIIRAIESIYVDRDLKQDNAALKKFYLEDNKSRFKYVQSTGGVHYYRIPVSDSTGNSSMMCIMQMPNYGPDSDPRQYAKKMLDNYGEDYQPGLRIRSSAATKINGIPAYKMEAVKTIPSIRKDILIYSCALTGDSFSVVVAGLEKNDNSGVINDFKLLTQAIRLKK
jgi:hypothetical protein